MSCGARRGVPFGQIDFAIEGNEIEIFADTQGGRLELESWTL